MAIHQTATTFVLLLLSSFGVSESKQLHYKGAKLTPGVHFVDGQVFVRPTLQSTTLFLKKTGLSGPNTSWNDDFDWDQFWSIPLMKKNFTKLLKLHGLVEIPSMMQRSMKNPFSLYMGFRHIRLINSNTGLSLKLINALHVNGFTTDLNYVTHLTTVPNDPLYQQRYQKINLAPINVESAWGLSYKATFPNGTLVKVCVIDTGIDCSHPDLSENCLSIGNPFKSGDHSDVGIVYDVSTSKMISRYAPPLQQDPNGHGTVVSGILAARGDNGHGMTGMVWKDTGIIGCNAVNDEDLEDNGIDKVMRCLEFCKQAGAKITQNSYNIDKAPFSKVLYDKFMDFGRSGGLSMMSAGNERETIPADFYKSFNPINPGNTIMLAQPSGYGPIQGQESKTMINVGASASCQVNGAYKIVIASYSGYGTPYVDIFAPGGAPGLDRPNCLPIIGPASKDSVLANHASFGDDLIITEEDNNNITWRSTLYIPASGTSFASPLVAGVVAMVWARMPTLSNVQVRKIVLSTATSDIPLQYPDGYKQIDGGTIPSTFGLLNAYNALQCTVPQNFKQSSCAV